MNVKNATCFAICQKYIYIVQLIKNYEIVKQKSHHDPLERQNIRTQTSAGHSLQAAAGVTLVFSFYTLPGVFASPGALRCGVWWWDVCCGCKVYVIHYHHYCHYRNSRPVFSDTFSKSAMENIKLPWVCPPFMVKKLYTSNITLVEHSWKPLQHVKWTL